MYAQLIIIAIQTLEPPGKFLLKDPITNLWNDIGEIIFRDDKKESKINYFYLTPFSVCTSLSVLQYFVYLLEMS